MLLNHIFYRRNDKGGKEYFPPPDVTPIHDADGHIVGGTLADGTRVEYDGVGKMGKTERNGVDPQDLIDQYGADTARLYVMFIGGPEDASVWSDASVEGAHRFLKRLWAFCADRYAVIDNAPAIDGIALEKSMKDVRFDVHAALKQASHDYERMQYNTIVSAGMKMLNALETVKDDGSPEAVAVVREGLGLLLRVLYPVAPHISWALWNELGYIHVFGDLLDAPFPQPDAAALARDEIELVVQVNGKLRSSIRVPATADRSRIEQAAIADTTVQKFLAGQAVKRVVVVPGKLVNVVV
jgi:leucyl-tRNA synthetase